MSGDTAFDQLAAGANLAGRLGILGPPLSVDTSVDTMVTASSCAEQDTPSVAVSTDSPPYVSELIADAAAARTQVAIQLKQNRQQIAQQPRCGRGPGAHHHPRSQAHSAAWLGISAGG